VSISLTLLLPPRAPLLPYTTLFRSALVAEAKKLRLGDPLDESTTLGPVVKPAAAEHVRSQVADAVAAGARCLIDPVDYPAEGGRSEEHTSELQSRFDLVCRLLLEKK